MKNHIKFGDMLKLTQKPKSEEQPREESQPQQQPELKENKQPDPQPPINDQIGSQKVDSHTPNVGSHNDVWTATSGQPQMPKMSEIDPLWLPTSPKVDSHFSNSPTKIEPKIEETNKAVNLESGQPQIQLVSKVATHKPEIKTKTDRHTKKQLTLRYDDTLLGQVKDFCKERGLELQEFHERAVMFYIENVASHKQGVSVEVDSHKAATHISRSTEKWLPHDDLKIRSLMIEDIIMLYERLTEKKWRAKDERDAKALRDLDNRAIVIGMIHTYFNAFTDRRDGSIKPFKPIINSFNYFIPEIMNISDQLSKYTLQDIQGYFVTRKPAIDKFLKKQGRQPIFEKPEVESDNT